MTGKELQSSVFKLMHIIVQLAHCLCCEAMLHSYLYNLTGLKVMVSIKRLFDYTPEIQIDSERLVRALSDNSGFNVCLKKRDGVAHTCAD